MARQINDEYGDEYDDRGLQRRALLGQMSSSAQPASGGTPDVSLTPPSSGALPPSATPPSASPPVTYPEKENSGITPVDTPAPKYGAIQGFDYTKLSTGGGTPGKYTDAVRVFSQFLGGGGTVSHNNLGAAVAHAKANGFPNARAVGDDSIDFGDGNGPIDVIMGNGSIWFQNGADRFGGKATGGAPGVPTGNDNRGINAGGGDYDPRSGYQFGYTGQLPPEIAQFYSAQTQAIQRQQAEQAQVQAAMRDALLRMMAQGQEPVDVANDKTLGPAAATYRNAARREQKQGREALAERAAFMGLNSGGQGSGAFETAIQGQEQDTQNAIAGYEANLGMSELQNRRTLLTQALQMANALGARTEAAELQREMAALDAQLRKQSLGFNYAQLGQNQSQFEDSMGYNWGNLQYQMNRDALLAGLNG